jgi:hypothetical protein
MTLHRRLYISAIGTFVIGAIAGLLLFFTAENDASGMNYQIIGGQAYATNPTDSKAYDAQLERMGGRSAVFADQFNRWFGGLWHGRNLGVTLCALSALLALALFWIAREVERDYQYKNSSKTGAEQLE